MRKYLSEAGFWRQCLSYTFCEWGTQHTFLQTTHDTFLNLGYVCFFGCDGSGQPSSSVEVP